MYPYTLNSAVDNLLKNEFDQYRQRREIHPELVKANINAIPFSHPELNRWRTNQSGIKFLHEPTNLLIFGAVDDVWINPEEELIIVDYKATSSNKKPSLDDRDSYKRQMEIYQWLFRQNEFRVSSIGYFYYCNGIKDEKDFSSSLSFQIDILSYEGDSSWVENKIFEIKECLDSNVIPNASETCDYCKYFYGALKHHNSLIL